jgi:Type II CAAX prenyl endopeptidase Rce1-like
LRNSFFNIFNFSHFGFEQHSIFIKLKNLLYSLLLHFCLLCFALMLVVIPLDLFVTKTLNYESIILLIQKTSLEIEKKPFYIIIFLVPLLEETLFRLILKFNKLNISIFIGFFLYFAIGGKVMHFEPEKYRSYITICLAVMMIYFINRFLPLKIISFLDSKKKILIFLSIFCFGLAHIMNIRVFYWQLTLIYPFYVLPQMISGYFITNLRLKYGFVWGLLFHASINAIPFLLAKP